MTKTIARSNSRNPCASPSSALLLCALLLAAGLPASTVAASAGATGNTGTSVATGARQDHESLRQAVEQFLRQQAGAAPEDVAVTVNAIDTRLSLPACAAPDVFLPNGSRAWGKTSVGIRCGMPTPWTIYVSAQVRVNGDYYLAATPLAPGQLVQASDLIKTRGDLGALPAGVVTHVSQAVGSTVTRAVQPGTALRTDGLRGQQVVQQGQPVRLVSGGAGFRVSAEGRAMANGTQGQLVQARTQNGQLVSGIARAGGVVEIAW